MNIHDECEVNLPLHQPLSLHNLSLGTINRTIENKETFLRQFQDEQLAGSSTWSNICRICHGGESYEDLVGPCKCKGSIALAHISCLERWLTQADKSSCELCSHHFEVHRKPKYSIFKSVFKWLRNPGEHTLTLIEDIISFCLYTPATFTSCCILMLLCESVTPTNVELNNYTAEMVAFLAVSGIAAIDFTYSYWLITRMHVHILAWRTWYRENSCLTIILPPRKQRPRRPDLETDESEID